MIFIGFYHHFLISLEILVITSCMFISGVYLMHMKEYSPRCDMADIYKHCGMICTVLIRKMVSAFKSGPKNHFFQTVVLREVAFSTFSMYCVCHVSLRCSRIDQVNSISIDLFMYMCNSSFSSFKD